ncbi:hypothetical protein CDD83_7453 [Cordyceps sp. RAO-2017]|nr:hypothetical protein CDD83_7453 [Cordyceps sp. RAO-2017]
MHWIFPCIGSAMTSFGFGAISDIVLTVVIDSYPDIIAQAFVVIAFFRNVLSMAGVFGLTPWRKHMGAKTMFIIVACVSFAVTFMALPLAIWGKKARIATADRYRRFAKPTS